MITPSSIVITNVPGLGFQDTRIRATLSILAESMITLDPSHPHYDDAVNIATKQVRAQVWHHVFGGMLPQMQSLRVDCLAHLGDNLVARHRIDDSFNAILKDLKP